MPAGTVVSFGAGAKELAPNFLFGGSPARLLRLSAKGVEALDELRTGPASSLAGATLARQLTDAGLADPRPGLLAAKPTVTVVVPVRDRARQLDDCLRSLQTES